MTDLSISNVVNISVAAANPGVNAYNTSNLAIITGEPIVQNVQQIAFSGTPASGAFTLSFNNIATASIAYNATITTLQEDILAVSGLSNVSVSATYSGSAITSITFSQAGNLAAMPLAVVTANTLQTSGSVVVALTPSILSAPWSGGTNSYSMYVSPTSVGVDFGTSSRTYKMANAVFSQQPNILNGGGQLIVIQRQVGQQTISFSAIPTSGDFALEYDGNTTSTLDYNATAAQVQAALQALPGLSQVQVFGSTEAQQFTVVFNGVYGATLTLTAPTNTLTVGTVPVTITIATVHVGETYGEAIARTQGLVQYFGVMPTETVATIGETDVLAAAAIVLPLNIISFNVSYTEADIQTGGMIYLLASGNFNNYRGLYYGDSSSNGINALLMMAAYAGKALSVNFNGSNTTITMNLKQLLGILPDPSMTQTIWNEAKAAGADIYVSYQGNSAVVSNGANKFFDQVYNLEWFVGALQVAGYNYLAQAATKIPQTEQGMDGLKGAYRNICQQAVVNQYSAPGTWTSPTTFGNQQLFLQNISQYGYYIYSQPISQQLATARAERQAPLVQVALKEAGAIQSSDVLVFINP